MLTFSHFLMSAINNTTTRRSGSGGNRSIVSSNGAGVGAVSAVPCAEVTFNIIEAEAGVGDREAGAVRDRAITTNNTRATIITMPALVTEFRTEILS